MSFCVECFHDHLDYLEDEPCVSCGCQGPSVAGLREALAANLFDGSEDGQVTEHVRSLLTDIVWVVRDWIKDKEKR